MLLKFSSRIFVLLTCTLLSTGTLQAHDAGSKHFKRKSSGWANRTAFDANENGERLNTITTIGDGFLGKSMNNEVGETGSFEGQFCEFDPVAGVFVIEIRILTRSRIMRFSNGDMLFAELDTDGQTNRLCVDVTSDVSTSEAHYVITGGTGKFEGATGRYTVTGESYTIQREAGLAVHVAITQKTHGEIQRAGKGR